MADKKPTDKEREAAAEAIMIQVAGMLLESEKVTGDPRITSLTNTVIAELEKTDILRTLLMTFAKTTTEPPAQVDPFQIKMAQTRQQMADRFNQ